MKLYTEEQVRKAIELSRDTHQEGNPYHVREEYDYSINEVIYLLTPIELPSDEEISEEADSLITLESYNQTFKMGAKWMRDKIQGGNK